MLESMLRRYSLESADDYHSALREILQEITLAGLYRGGFFEKAAFYGGTCLRIFYKLDRFSEDLDFSLLKPDPDFRLDTYFSAIKTEFEALGIEVDIKHKPKRTQTAIESAFLKNNTEIHELSLSPRAINLKSLGTNRPIKIKFEVDTKPPAGFKTEQRLLLLPFSFYVKCYVVEDLFAGKMHALLFRNWKQRVKGRDWYDFEWYVKNGYRLNLDHLAIRATESGHIDKASKFSQDSLMAKLETRIATLDIENLKVDIRRFIKDARLLDIWSRDYFLELSTMMRIAP